MIPLAIAPDLMEEAVLLAERQARPGLARAFRRERNPIYEVADPELREARFGALALEWFGRFGLRATLEATIGRHSTLAGSVAGGRIVRAITPRAEGADLIDVARQGSDQRPLLVVRLTPQSLLDAGRLSRLLRHELMHVSDMLDPAFGYRRDLPSSGDGPSADNILRDRYRVAWDTTIDGRLARGEEPPPETRDLRWREFSSAFGMLADRCPDAFEHWWNRAHPTHAEILAFATAPAGTAFGRAAGRCPFCHFPVAALDSRVSTLTEPVLAALRADHPSWHAEQGICPQCLDLYEARYGNTATAAR
jgi:hypothetical protein